jgi:hypothetical protein
MDGGDQHGAVRLSLLGDGVVATGQGARQDGQRQNR